MNGCLELLFVLLTPCSEMAAIALQHTKLSIDDQLTSDFATSAQFEDVPFKEFMRILFSFLTAPKYVCRAIDRADL